MSKCLKCRHSPGCVFLSVDGGCAMFKPRIAWSRALGAGMTAVLVLAGLAAICAKGCQP